MNNLFRIWGHYVAYALCGILLSVIILVKVYLPFAVILAAGLGFIALALISWATLRRHDKHLCERCISSMPLNPGEIADNKNKFLLSLVHTPIGFILGYIGIVLIVDIAIMRYGSDSWVYFVWIIVHAPILVFMHAHVTHFRLQPWCPNCRERGIDKPIVNRVLT